MKFAWTKYVIVENGATRYYWQIFGLYGAFTKLRYWWRRRSPGRRRITEWRAAMYVRWDKNWRLNL